MQYNKIFYYEFKNVSFIYIMHLFIASIIKLEEMQERQNILT